MTSEEHQSQQQQDNSNKSSPITGDNTYYARKKNWIGGVDNDTVLGVGIGLVGTLAAVAAYPIFKNIWENYMTRLQYSQQLAQQQLQGQGQENYIAPTEAQNGQVQQQQQVQQPTTTVEQPTVEQQGQEQEGEEDEDGVFYEKELKRRQKVMGMKKRGSKYESPFGRDIGGLG